jgi:hypothetical protein
MNRLLFAVMGTACFAAGWWLDLRAGEREGGSSGKKKERAQSVRGTTGVKTGGMALDEARSRSAAGAHSAEELLKLFVRGREMASQAQMDRAVAGLGAETLADFAAGLDEMKKERGVRYDEALERALIAVAGRWLALDPGPASEFALKNDRRPLGALYYPFLEGMKKLFRDDMPAATRIMASLRGEDRELYIYARFEGIEGLKGMEPEAALKSIAAFDARTRNQWHGAQALGEFPRLWIEKDAPAAMNWALGLPPGYTRHRILTTMAQAWTKSEPAKAAAFLESVPLSTLPESALRKAIAGCLGIPENGSPAKQ